MLMLLALTFVDRRHSSCVLGAIADKYRWKIGAGIANSKTIKKIHHELLN